MKKFALWLTMVIMFSLPALVFAQATGGSTDKAAKEEGTGRKGRTEDKARKGASGKKTVKATTSDNKLKKGAKGTKGTATDDKDRRK
jgi:hypothetical protein